MTALESKLCLEASIRFAAGCSTWNLSRLGSIADLVPTSSIRPVRRGAMDCSTWNSIHRSRRATVVSAFSAIFNAHPSTCSTWNVAAANRSRRLRAPSAVAPNSRAPPYDLWRAISNLKGIVRSTKWIFNGAEASGSYNYARSPYVSGRCADTCGFSRPDKQITPQGLGNRDRLAPLPVRATARQV